MWLALGILMMLPLVAQASENRSTWASSQQTNGKPDQRGPKSNKSDHELLQGTWAVVCVWHNGKPEDTSVELQLTVAGDKWTVGAQGAIKYLEVAQSRLDATSTPKRLDLTYGAAAHRTGIYELWGDTLKLCVAPPDKPRPTEMVTKEGDHHILVLLKRVQTRSDILKGKKIVCQDRQRKQVGSTLLFELNSQFDLPQDARSSSAKAHRRRCDLDRRRGVICQPLAESSTWSFAPIVSTTFLSQ
jgi:uncharacterized protein (TIGR03067 family)